MTVYLEKIEYALPDIVVTNADLERAHPTWDMERLVKRTGVKSRHIAALGETALDLGYRAARYFNLGGIDALIFCTETPDYQIPPNACVLHKKLGLQNNVMAFDIDLGCSGFVYGLGIARSLVMSETARRVLLVAGDTYSHLIHPADRAVRSIFGDGVAAAIIGTTKVVYEILDISFATSGHEHEHFIVRSGGARHHPASMRNIEMDGAGILSFFSGVLPTAVRDLLGRNGKSVDDIGLFVFHQASRVIIDKLTNALSIPADRVIFAMEDTGNLVSASIPVALRRAGEIAPGTLVVLCGFGVGLSWATALVRAC